MKISPTPLTAALAGGFSALVWPMLWSRFGNSASAAGIELVVATLLVIALPAHAFVVGFSPPPTAGARTGDITLLKRIAAWLGAAVAMIVVVAVIRG